MTTPALYFHTVRHLRPIQIAARAWRRVHRPRADLRPAPARRKPSGPYQRPLERPPTLVAADTFRLLNVERRCATAADWHPLDVAQLWRYHLHYFDDLNAVHPEVRARWHRPLLERWVEENPPARVDAWDPYPVSRRLANWVKWAARGNVLPAACHASLAVQARWLSDCLEYHLLGNHLLANAKALMHAGLYFEGAEAERWYRRGMDILAQQLGEQVLADGGHFELSVMYHTLALEDLLDLINLPSLNIDGLRSEDVGRQSRTIIPSEATATVDLRLVKGIAPNRQVERLIAHIKKQGYLVTEDEPNLETRLKHPLIARVVSEEGYPAVRTPMNLPIVKQLISAVEKATGQRPVLLPTMGGSGPLWAIDVATRAPQVGVPIVNHDNNQHSSNENLRIRNLWDGIEIFAELMTM